MAVYNLIVIRYKAHISYSFGKAHKYISKYFQLKSSMIDIYIKYLAGATFLPPERAASSSQMRERKVFVSVIIGSAGEDRKENRYEMLSYTAEVRDPNVSLAAPPPFSYTEEYFLALPSSLPRSLETSSSNEWRSEDILVEASSVP